ncbi:hypothetical protein [Cohnella faecalis]|uniref:hypothetical protein n=1 Tax=Cohnella faecalis TaxID=2315694 RepID=UPI002D76AA35|nr:hypothetical protein [Cohnella faecalis]
MEYLIKKLPKFGGTVVQTEDEIAAVTMAIGANYAGVRTMTASAVRTRPHDGSDRLVGYDRDPSCHR